MDEVLGHALLLSSPIAACYGAKLLARLLEHLEESSRRGFSHRQSLARCGAFGLPAGGRTADSEQFDVKGCLQYNNDAFSCQSTDGYGSDAPAGDEEDEELDFCCLTPAQALGALGDHAPQYTKIFLNGSTFVADRSEPGTVLSVDEYADRMHSSSVSRSQSLGGSPCADALSGCLGADPWVTGCVALRAAATDGCTPSSRLSSNSDSSSLTSLSSCGRSYSNSVDTFSGRSSLEVSLQLYGTSLTLAQDDCDSAPVVCIDEKDTFIEDSYYCTTSQRCPPALEVSSSLDKVQSCMWRDADAVATAASGDANDGHCAAPRTPRMLATPPRAAASPTMSTNGDCGVSARVSRHAPLRRSVQLDAAPRELEFGRAKGPAAAAAAAKGCASAGRQALRHSETPRSASHGGAVAHDKPAQRRWVPAGARSVPPLPPPTGSGRGILLSSSCSSRTSIASTQDGDVASGWDVVSAPHSPQPARPRLCVVASGAAPASPSACTAGLSRAPALPLPDGMTLESAVPPALRYYLAQARAAGTQDVQGDASEGEAAGEAARRRSLDAEGGIAGGVGASRRGFVRATVEQLNTQRLVCCHVTPFAVSKTSRKSRPLAHRVDAI